MIYKYFFLEVDCISLIYVLSKYLHNYSYLFYLSNSIIFHNFRKIILKSFFKINKSLKNHFFIFLLKYEISESIVCIYFPIISCLLILKFIEIFLIYGCVCTNW
jgi:hypothetical protein